MEWLSIIYTEHNKWVNYVKSFGEKDYYEDIVQEMYIKIGLLNLENVCIKDGKPNNNYIWYVLKNLHLDYVKSKNKIVKVQLLNIECQYSECDMQHEYANERINQLIINEMNSWNWYDKMLFDTYRKTGKSFRKLGDEIKIHPFSIYRTIKGCKDKLIEALGEDYEDYVNRDFELIK
jgi:hypothetical protein